ncbi:MAG: DNA-protecting protein DprA [Acidobacteria bacterium]|nr:DNA-protecting protein DprA [Acidobacteriota bacterium]
MASQEAVRETLLSWLALQLVPGLGPRNAIRLVKIFGFPERIFHSSLSELEAALPKLRKATAEAIHSGLTFEDAADALRKAEGLGVEIIPFQDPRYPQQLKEIFDPPLLLYALGREELLARPQVAMVGTRSPTPYGRAVAEKMGREIAAAGLTHVSGMARGVDACSHRGALQKGGDTIAVLGTGVDVPYPRENRALYEAIREEGLVISEFPLGTSPRPENFPIRNRIISGMSLGVMVVEGAQYSGSLITARLALDQGREVFAIPGSIVSPQSWGPNLLIKDGAKLVQDIGDVIEELPDDVRQALARPPAAAGRDPENPNGVLLEGASGPAQRVFRLLRVDQALHIDDLIRECEEAAPAVTLAALSELELFGAVKQLPGKHFVRVWS